MKCNKYLAGFLCLSVLICCFLTGCGSKAKSEKENPDYSFSLNFHKDEYDPEYNHYEKTVIVEKDNTRIDIEGSTLSGRIDVEIINGDGTSINKYSFSDSFNASIDLDNISGEWKVFIDCYEDTEGFIKFSLY